MKRKQETPVQALRVKDICAAVESWAPPFLACEWDKSGLNIGNPEWEVSRISVMLSVTPDLMTQAMAKGVDMIVSHHPVVWNPLTHLRDDTPETRLCLDLVRAEVACYSAHTNLDVAPGGVNEVLAERLGLGSLAPLFPRFAEATASGDSVKLATFVPGAELAALREALCAAGGGVIGDYTCCTFSSEGVGTFLPGDAANPFVGKKGVVNEQAERRLELLVPKARLSAVLAALKAAHPYEEPAFDIYPLDRALPAVSMGVRARLERPLRLDAFAGQVCKALGLSHVRVLGDGKRMISSVALMGGGGGSKAREVPEGCDVYVTGDIGYHDGQVLLDRGIAAIDAGHGGTERCIVPVLADFLRQRFPALHVFAHEEPEPFHVVAAKTV